MQVAFGLVLFACGLPGQEPASLSGFALAEEIGPESLYRGFGEPKLVTIRGYDDHAMEPFISRDGRYLLFNNRNDSQDNTNLHFAKRIDDLTFDYQGEIQGVNTAALEGVPSMDQNGMLYFVSPRSYSQTFSTLYRGRFKDGLVHGVELVPGVSQNLPGIVNFDAEISNDGKTLVFVDGIFLFGDLRHGEIAIATLTGTKFKRDSNSKAILSKVNHGALNYAPALGPDGLELFFTRVESLPASSPPVILRADRKTIDGPFQTPQHIAGLTGFVEAPTLTSDGKIMYFHKKENGRHVIYCVTR
jgi:hypothetical protein